MPSEEFWSKWQKTTVSANTPPPEIYRANLPTLSSLYDPLTNGVLALELIILEILEFMGIEWSENLTKQCSELAYMEYYWFNIGELKQFVSRVKLGYFGKIYGKFSPAILMEYLMDYSSEMLIARERYFGMAKVVVQVDSEPLTPEEEARQSEFFKKLTDIAKTFTTGENEEDRRKEEERKKRIQAHQEFYRSTLTPDQLQDIENNRLRIQKASDDHESNNL